MSCGWGIHRPSKCWPPGLFPQSPVMALVCTEIVSRVHRALAGTLDKGSGPPGLDPKPLQAFCMSWRKPVPFLDLRFSCPQVTWLSSQKQQLAFLKCMVQSLY